MRFLARLPQWVPDADSSRSRDQADLAVGPSGREDSGSTPGGSMRRIHSWQPAVLLSIAGCSLAPQAPSASAEGEAWLAGDHHVHSRFSVGWDDTVELPRPRIGAEGIYPIPTNAEMARSYGLSWMVSTDHGGPNHSRLNLETAYPELVSSRALVPGLIQFYGMELDTPGAEHSSLIVPHTHDEAERLYELESRFSRRDPWPLDTARQRESFMLDALRAMRALAERPVLLANHPSRSADGLGEYGQYHPAELRDWSDAAPDVAVGMEGAPWHQASAGASSAIPPSASHKCLVMRFSG